jgi:hypothetical protein
LEPVAVCSATVGAVDGEGACAGAAATGAAGSGRRLWPDQKIGEQRGVESESQSRAQPKPELLAGGLRGRGCRRARRLPEMALVFGLAQRVENIGHLRVLAVARLSAGVRRAAGRDCSAAAASARPPCHPPPGRVLAGKLAPDPPNRRRRSRMQVRGRVGRRPVAKRWRSQRTASPLLPGPMIGLVGLQLPSRSDSGPVHSGFELAQAARSGTARPDPASLDPPPSAAQDHRSAVPPPDRISRSAAGRSKRRSAVPVALT